MQQAALLGYLFKLDPVMILMDEDIVHRQIRDAAGKFVQQHRNALDDEIQDA